MDPSRKTRFVLLVALVILWVMLTGSFEPASLGAGIAVSALIVQLTWRPLLLGTRHVGAPSARPLDIKPLEILKIFPRFMFDILKASAEVAIIALKPRIDIRPGIVRVDSHLKNKTALVFLANYITLTPGTLTVDIDTARHHVFIHALDLGTLDAPDIRNEVAMLEKRLGRVLE